MSGSQSFASRHPTLLGGLSAMFGLVGLAALVWTWLLSTTPLNPPEWLRITGVLLLPIGFVGALITGIPALRGAGRPAAVVGLVAAGMALIGFVLAITLLG